MNPDDLIDDIIPANQLNTPGQLLDLARRNLEAATVRSGAHREGAARLAAARVASVALIARSQPQSYPSVWDSLARVAPEYGDWVDYFSNPQHDDPDDVVLRAQQFTDVVSQDLGTER